MNTITVTIVGLFIFILFYMIVRAPKGAMSFVGKGAVRLTIGLLLLFFFNVFGGQLGLHIPINIFTVVVTTVLGPLGIISIAAVHIFVL
ncbi:pro-sigmaK processing inhibitor BofA family protein [Pseudogracilibacillus sp. ICA-222130]|uniref:pro-sigmaK processing inhibitor BofA family protein n=1 Tax=Pseudogracilibacillus sp. ICA-222130 TaxID=3134655 RepID=UPI0030BE9CCD